MPPKKKEEKKAGNGGAEVEPNDQEKELIEKELVITYLKNRLGRYQEQGDSLLLDNLKLSDELENSKCNLKEINEFLTNELKARALTSAALEQKLQDNQAAYEEEFNRLHVGGTTYLSIYFYISHFLVQNEIKVVQQELQVERAINEERETETKKKMKMYTQFLGQKDQMEAELQDLRKKLSQLEIDTEEKLRTLIHVREGPLEERNRGENQRDKDVYDETHRQLTRINDQTNHYGKRVDEQRTDFLVKTN
eukprot:TRINITY_DN10963_c0_g1_i1.p1 TRINITY_DN10963_c0_g1~~TRINITY_DN10963_c0_g1_i1.p1  ORF type:complete len:251 (-),score=42.48 TRINITY_DN10963_c0_g1_i1:21-773(-)